MIEYLFVLAETTKIWGFPMRRTWPILVATTALFAGCSSGESTPTTTIDSTSAASPVVAQEEVTPEADFFSSQFHPCEAFSDVQFERAGLGDRTNATENPESVVKACGFTPRNLDDLAGTFLVGTDVIDQNRIADLELQSLKWQDSQIKEVYVHQMTGEARECTAAVDFEWGRFFVAYRELGEGWDPEELCSDSVSILEALILQSGGTNGIKS